MKLKIASFVFSMLFVTMPIKAQEHTLLAKISATHTEGARSDILIPQKGLRVNTGNVSVISKTQNTETSLAVPIMYVEAGNKEYSGLGDPVIKFGVDNKGTSALFSLIIPSGLDGVSGKETVTRLGISWREQSPDDFMFGGISWLRAWNSTIDGYLYQIGFGTQVNRSLLFQGGISNMKVVHSFEYQSATLKLTVVTSKSSGVEVQSETGVGRNEAWSIGVSHFWKL